MALLVHSGTAATDVQVWDNLPLAIGSVVNLNGAYWEIIDRDNEHMLVRQVVDVAEPPPPPREAVKRIETEVEHEMALRGLTDVPELIDALDAELTDG